MHSTPTTMLLQVPAVSGVFSMVKVPMVTFMVVGVLCIFNSALLKTRLGQQFRAVGQNRTVANASGIHVDRVRVIAIMISTVLAGWGQLIFVQNMGSFQTYGAHEQVGLYAGAAILVGGAGVRKATNGQAILGCILFHLLFIVAPAAGKNLFGDSAIGEYFRVFISYGVIAAALVMHAWSGVQKKKSAKEALTE
jgi:simple sugar transport system permease protein